MRCVFVYRIWYTDGQRVGMDGMASSVPIIRRVQLVDEVADALRDAIIRGDLRPGARLVQDQLAERFGVSRTPVRDALKKLAQEGLISFSRGNRVEVRRLALGDVIDLYEVREVLDGLAARLAARSATEDEIHALKRTLWEMQRAVGDWDPHRWLVANFEFHERIAGAARNRTLDQLAAIVRHSAQAFYPTVLQHRERAVVALHEHEEILAAIAARDPVAEVKARHHILSAKAFLLSLQGEGLGEAPSPVRDIPAELVKHRPVRGAEMEQRP